MGYFDNITEISFKEGKDGETLYFPNGVFGKGRLIEDPTRKKKIFKYQKRLNKYFMPFCILYGMLMGLGGGVTLEGFMPLFILGILALIRQRILIRGLPIYNEKLNLKETTKATSKAIHPALIIFMVLSGVASIILSLSFPFILNKPFSEIQTLVLIPLVVGIISTAISLYFYKLRKSNKAIKKDV